MGELFETIPDFLTPQRYKNFEQAVIEGSPERIDNAQDEISQAKRLRKFAPAITDLLEVAPSLIA